MHKNIIKLIYPITILLILLLAYFFPTVHRMSAGIALLSGILLSLAFTNPYEKFTKNLASTLLTWSVIGLGFGMNLLTVMRVGAEGIGYTLFTIAICALIGLQLGKWLKNHANTSVLITFGTAICGGSAIAAIAPTIRAQQHEMTVALAVVFSLNAVALFLFPFIGSYFHLSQAQFGLWSALAIHDTSSVVGATMQYGPEALDVGTTVKLARALWIVPLTLLISTYYRLKIFKNNTDDQQAKPKKPWFILGFLLASAIVTWIPALRTTAGYLHDLAEMTLIITLFCIGSNLSTKAIQTVGMKPLLQGVLLWGLMAWITFFVVA